MYLMRRLTEAKGIRAQIKTTIAMIDSCQELYISTQIKESDEKLPQYQREGGDFIEWENPNTKNKLVMVASGLGDGFYQSYWGYDSNNDICELIVPLVNPDLFGL